MKPFLALTALIAQSYAATPPPRFVEFTGQLHAPETCGSKAEVFVADGKSRTLLYQVDALSNGSFFFRLKAGNYEFRAVSTSGCEALAYLKLELSTPTRTQDFTLKQKRKDQERK